MAEQLPTNYKVDLGGHEPHTAILTIVGDKEDLDTLLRLFHGAVGDWNRSKHVAAVPASSPCAGCPDS